MILQGTWPACSSTCRWPPRHTPLREWAPSTPTSSVHTALHSMATAWGPNKGAPSPGLRLHSSTHPRSCPVLCRWWDNTSIKTPEPRSNSRMPCLTDISTRGWCSRWTPPWEDPKAWPWHSFTQVLKHSIVFLWLHGTRKVPPGDLGSFYVDLGPPNHE